MANSVPAAPSRTVLPLGINQTATISATADSNGRVAVLTDPNGQPSSFTTLAASASLVFGPFGSLRWLSVEAIAGSGISYTIAADDRSKLQTVGDFSNLRFVTNSGAPDSTVGAGTCGPGSLCVDTSTPDLYVATGSRSAPAWKKVTRTP
jgi:hypothetical protein